MYTKTYSNDTIDYEIMHCQCYKIRLEKHFRMKPNNLQIKDYYLPVNLHKILLEPNFHPNPVYREDI